MPTPLQRPAARIGLFSGFPIFSPQSEDGKDRNTSRIHVNPEALTSLSSLAYDGVRGPKLKSRKELFAQDVVSSASTLPEPILPSTAGTEESAEVPSTVFTDSSDFHTPILHSNCTEDDVSGVRPLPSSPKVAASNKAFAESSDFCTPTVPSNCAEDDVSGCQPLPSSPKVAASKKSSSKSITHLKAQLVEKKKTIHRLHARINRLERKKQKAPVMSHEEIVAASKPLLNPTMNRLLEAQLRLKKCKSSKGMRWSDDMKDFATSLLYHGPRSYRFLRKLMPLPSISTLNKFQRKAYLLPGIHEPIKLFLKDNVKKWSTKKKVCLLVIDEISIKENLSYDEREDLVVGFSDDGTTRTKDLANQVIVAAFKGIDSAWKQVIGHWVSFDKDRTKSIRKSVIDCIRAANEIGLIVKLLICDQGSKNRKLARLLGVTKRKPYFMNGAEKIYFMWDPPHLLKSIRNNLMKYDFLWRGGIASWSHLRALLKRQERLRLHLIPKITRGHLYFRSSFSKMKVKLASQVLSRSVYTALLVFIALNLIPSSAVHMANVTKDFNDLFDCFNGMQYERDRLSLRYAISLKSKHIPFLKKILRYLNSAAFLGAKRQPECLEGWIISITALLLLVQELAERFGISSVRARLLSQDMLENLFGILRQQQGCNDNPTVKQLEKGIRHLTLSSLSKISNATNCEEEVEKSLIVLSKLPQVIRSKKEEEITVTPGLDKIEHEKGMDVIEENALYYCCGFITRVFARKHKCNFCASKLLLQGDQRIWTEDYQMFLYFKAHSEELGQDFGHLQAPSYESFQVLKKMERVFNEVFAARCHEKNISKIIQLAFKNQQLTLQLCSGEAEEEFARTLIRLRILWEVRFMNRRIVTARFDKLDKKKKTETTAAESTQTDEKTAVTPINAGTTSEERDLKVAQAPTGVKRKSDRKDQQKLKKLRHE